MGYSSYAVVKMGGSIDFHPDKPVITGVDSHYLEYDTITINWTSGANTTHCNYWLHQKQGGEWKTVHNIFYASGPVTENLEVGEYRVYIGACNADYWEEDGSTWLSTDSDYVYFSVVSLDYYRPDKPVITGVKDCYLEDETITISWTTGDNTTHCNYWLFQKQGDEWVKKNRIFYATGPVTENLEIGEYRVYIGACNSNYWEADGSTWLSTDSDYVYFSVVSREDFRPDKPVITGVNSSYFEGETIIIDWTYGANTTHCNYWLFQKQGDEWVKKNRIFYATGPVTENLEIGEYRVYIGACNSNYWEADGSTWLSTDSDYVYFSVVHNLIHHEAQAPTCTEIGWEAYDTCSRCDYTTYVEIKALDHDLIHHEAQAPTCTEIGWEAYDTCSRCDYSTYVELKALDHDLIHHEAQAPTCTKIGWEAYDTCSRCDYSTYVEMAALDHDYKAVVTAPTCTERGYTTYTCSRCGDSYVADYVAALGHDFVDGFCTRCGAEDPDYTPDAKLTIYGKEASAASGSTITVPVLIKGGEKFAGFTLSISNSAELTLKSIEKGALLKNADGMFTPNIAQQTVNWISSNGTAGEGELLLLTYDVSAAAKEGSKLTINIGLKDGKPSNMADANEKPIGVNFEAITVTVQSVLSGDVNGDGSVDTIDAIRLAKYLVGLVELTDAQMKAADVNGDGSVDTIDAIRLAKYLVGLIGTLDSQQVRSAVRAPEGAAISVESVTVDPGETVTVPVMISGNPGFAGFTLTVTAAEGLTLKEIGKGALLTSAEGMFTANVANSNVNWTGAANVTGDGELLDLTFEVDAAAAAGDYVIGIELKDGNQSNFANADEQPVAVSLNGGKITVVSEPPTPGKPCDGGKDCPSYAFKDVNYGDWYHEAVDFAVTKGLFNGMSETTFEPNTAMSRAMLVTVLWRYEGEKKAGANIFTDVPDGQWYTDAVAWAAVNGIVGGVGDGKFDPNGNITREQMAAILYRYSESKGFDTSKTGDLNTFPDAAKLSDWAKTAYSWAVGEGLITGNDGKLDPQGNATRAQVATILMRFINKIA